MRRLDLPSHRRALHGILSNVRFAEIDVPEGKYVKQDAVTGALALYTVPHADCDGIMIQVAEATAVVQALLERLPITPAGNNLKPCRKSSSSLRTILICNVKRGRFHMQLHGFKFTFLNKRTDTIKSPPNLSGTSAQHVA